MLNKIAMAFAAAIIVQPHAQAADGVPGLRVIARNGAESLLIGSLHEAAEGLRQPADSVLDKANRYVIEGQADSGVRPAGNQKAPEVQAGAKRASWAAFLSTSQVEELRRRALCTAALRRKDPKVVGMVVDVLLTYRSAAAAAAIAITRCAPAGLLSRDELLARAAADRGLVASTLETQQIAQPQRDAVPERMNVAMVYDSFKPEADDGLRKTIHALNSGDYDEVRSAVRALAKTPADADLYYDLMVGSRNRAWLPVLMGYLDEGRAVINVGAYHLPGPEGLIALLRAKGYQVSPTTLPARD